MRIGLGLAALGRPAYINLGRDPDLLADRTVDAMRSATWRVLDAAYAAGVRWVDAARSYGRAEEFLGGWLADRGVDDITVSSKWGYSYVGDWRLDVDVHEIKEHSLAQFTRQWAETRELLGGRVSLYQVHSLTPDSPAFTDPALLEALAAMGASGVRVGFSTSGPRQAEVVDRALALRMAGQPVFTAVQSTWNVLEPSVGPALARAHDGGAHVLVKETLANGRLAVGPPDPLVRIAERGGVDPSSVAIAVVLAQPWADTVLIGPSSVGQLAANLLASDVELADDDRAQLAALGVDPDGYWADRAALAWH
ncbi:MAG TPA: aldo/keto reductase [Nocardioidaceae bacterium]|nr:aldo/keto reductase [Nocardioidaceae bacterium]